MTNFEIAFGYLMKAEGEHSNDPEDAGGETYNGISRRAHPKWKGWEIIDVSKKLKNFPDCLNQNAGLKKQVCDLYKAEYWDKVEGDEWPINLSFILFDIAVNCGVIKAVEILQRTINILNNNQKLYSDIKVDGIYGALTGAMLATCLMKRSNHLVCNVLRFFQAKHYIEIMESQPVKEKYIGWFNRVTINNNYKG